MRVGVLHKNIQGGLNKLVGGIGMGGYNDDNFTEKSRQEEVLYMYSL